MFDVLRGADRDVSPLNREATHCGHDRYEPEQDQSGHDRIPSAQCRSLRGKGRGVEGALQGTGGLTGQTRTQVRRRRTPQDAKIHQPPLDSPLRGGCVTSSCSAQSIIPCASSHSRHPRQRVSSRAIVVLRKAQRPVQFEREEATREAVAAGATQGAMCSTGALSSNA